MAPTGAIAKEPPVSMTTSHREGSASGCPTLLFSKLDMRSIQTFMQCPHTVFCFVFHVAGDALDEHNSFKFSTPDDDNDDVDEHCAAVFQSGWWFKTCQPEANLNGVYSATASVPQFRGLQWQGKRDDTISLKGCEMKIRKK